jgi:dihydrofolate reductase
MIITIIAAISADGKIAASADQLSLDWTSKEDTQFFVAKTKEIGTVVMGRKTFETIGKPLKDRRTIVLTRFLPLGKGEVGGGTGTVEWTDESPVDLVARLEKEGVTRLAVCGGAQVYSQFLQAGLVDELYLTVEPVLFGEGVPFATGCDRIDMELIDITRLGEKSTLLHFRLK